MAFRDYEHSLGFELDLSRKTNYGRDLKEDEENQATNRGARGVKEPRVKNAPADLVVMAGLDKDKKR
ncbi:hypothetical protein FJZ17_00430 [Candidatus Pacearchaeota archaeon]|nr:hypothetical protein [Candidatus Pacearchaeota archaeon]